MMTRDELFAQLIPLCNSKAALHDVLVTAWNHGKSDGFRECRAMIAEKSSSPPNGDPQVKP